jgi:hypothetical protein
MSLSLVTLALVLRNILPNHYQVTNHQHPPQLRAW